MPRLLAVVVLVFFAGCGGCGKSNNNPPADAAVPDAPSDVTCATLPPIASGTCAVTAGGTTTVIEGNVLTPTTVYHGGQVAFDSTGHITCTGCNCAQGGETTITCPDGVISPGLINTHDHITFTENLPYTDDRRALRASPAVARRARRPQEDSGAGQRDRRSGALGRAAVLDGRRDVDRRLGRPDGPAPQPRSGREHGRPHQARRRLRHVPARRLEAARGAPGLQLRRHRRHRRLARVDRFVRAAHLRRHRRDRAQRVPVPELCQLRHDDARRLEQPRIAEDVDDPRRRSDAGRLRRDGGRRHRRSSGRRARTSRSTATPRASRLRRRSASTSRSAPTGCRPAR